jgi:peptidoglycan hydrolase CwlO-like protein
MCARVYCLFLVLALMYVIPLYTSADTIADERARLQAQLAQVQTEIKETQSKLTAAQNQRTSYERDVAILDYKIKEAQLQIKQRDLTIQALKKGINQKQQSINILDEKVASDQASLAQILRNIQHMDDTPFIILALGGSLTDVFQDMDDFEQIQRAMNTSFTRMAAERSDLSARKNALEDQQQEEQDLLQLQVLQQKSLKAIEQQKKDLVAAVKGQEATYQTMIKAKQQNAAQIQAALFSLRDTKAVSFGDIYKYAKEAGIKTGVRPALILGILAEESNLGQNVGTGNWKVDMKSPRDTVPFQTITAKLGLNPDSMPVSKKPCYGDPCSGWGGAMGPAQFIPSTWILYEDRIAAASGQTPPNPWDPRTAAFATALLMADNGADQQTEQAERLAALRYLAGWTNATKPAYSFYGDDVMSLAAKFQKDIDILGG